MTKTFGESSYHRYLQGDVSALETFVGECGDTLVRFAYCFVRDSAAAEDIVQDAFATLIFKRRHFSERDNFRAYLYKTVRNKCLDYLRLHRKHVPLEAIENTYAFSSAEENVLRRERNEKLYACLWRLPAQYREVLYLAYFDGYKADELSEIIRKNKKQTYNLLARARSTLKELLQKEGISYENL